MTEEETPATYNLQKQRSVSPSLSMSSDMSKGEPLNFNNGAPSSHRHQRPVSPSLSMSSDMSKGEPLNFSSSASSFQKQRSVSPSLSISSDMSKGEPLNFNNGAPRRSATDPELIEPSISLKPGKGKDAKDRVTGDLKEAMRKELSRFHGDQKVTKIKDRERRKSIKHNDLFPKQVRTVLMTGVPGIGKTYQTKMFMIDWAKGKSNKDIESVVSFTFKELNEKKEKSMSDLLDDFFSQINIRVGDDTKLKKMCFILDGLEEYQLPLNFEENMELENINKEVTVDVLLTNLIKGNLLPSARLWIISQPQGETKVPREYIQKTVECQETFQQRKKLETEVKARLQREICQEKEEISHPNQRTMEHIVVREKGVDVKKTQVNSVSDIFNERNKDTIRTVLTVGEANTGKSFTAKKFSNGWTGSIFPKDVNLLFFIEISKLNLIRENKISLVGLLQYLFEETKRIVISDYTQFNIVFVLDGLDAFRHSLDFENNRTLTDVREPDSVNVILTNLIKKDLLPSAKVWITSQPSAAERIPDEFIDRKTLIREKPDITSKRNLKSQLVKVFTKVSEGIDRKGTSALLNEVFTDLYIIEGGRGEINAQNELKLIEDAKFKPVQEETILKYSDIFSSAPGTRSVKTVLTIGMAGIGKTFASMKYILDWAESEATDGIDFIFPIPFRELNLIKEHEHSLNDLIHQFFPAMKTSEITDYNKYKILVVLDGFDECQLDLLFKEDHICKDVMTPLSVNALLVNLILGNLLPEAKIWITSRPAASNNIPADKVDRMTEVRGFNEEQKEKYFRKRFKEQDLAENILKQVKKSRSLYIMCHIPVFCWITSTVLEHLVDQKQEEVPKTLTDMYTHFLLLQHRQAQQKYDNSCWDETIMCLGELAFKGLVKKILLFLEEDLSDCSVDGTKAAIFSGLLTQIKREDHGFNQQKLYCFVHLSIQEYMAALYVFHMFVKEGQNVFSGPPSKMSFLECYKTAVDKALANKNGDWDMFLRFLVGLSLKTNQAFLKGLLPEARCAEETSKDIIEYIRMKIDENVSDPDKNLNLLHCLNELNDHSLVDKIKSYLQSESKGFENFTASQWSALTFVLLTSDEKLDVFDLKKYLKSEKVLLGMLPIVRVSNTTLLSWCELSAEACVGLVSSVLQYPSSNLTLLDLSHNDLLDLGVERLAEGLKSQYCKLETLKLAGCQVTQKGCCSLADAIQSNRKSLLENIDLSYNHPEETGMRRLFEIVENKDWKLDKVCFEHSGEHRLKPGWKKYGMDLKLNDKTASKRLIVSERQAKTIPKGEERPIKCKNEETFKRTQVFCEKGVKGLCYWEVEWKGMVGISVAYKGVGRDWNSSGGFGTNQLSWNLLCSKDGYSAWHGKKFTQIDAPLSHKIAVFLDWEGGTLSYYGLSLDERNLIHTFKTEFTEELFLGIWFKRGSVTLCDF